MDTQTKTQVDVNAKFAETRLSQLKSAEARQNWLDTEVSAGRAQRLPGGRVKITQGWDAGEVFTEAGQPMTGLDTKANGETALYLKDEPAWHALGQVVPGGLTTASAVLEASGLNYTVGIRPTPFMLPDGDWVAVPDSFTTYREDTNQPMGVVGKGYRPVQNLESYSILDELLNHGMVAESAGSFRQGRKTFVSARIPDDLVVDPDGVGDIIRQYLMISNSHDGSSAVTAVVTPWRPVCKNTERFAVRDSVTKFTIRHTKNAMSKVEEARKALRLTHEYYAEWAAEEETLIQTPFSANQVDALINQVWGELDKDATDRAKRNHETRRSQLHVLYSLESERVGQNAYAAERAVTAQVDHFTNLRPRNDLKGRPMAALGQAILEESQDDVKTTAHSKLMLLARR